MAFVSNFPFKYELIAFRLLINFETKDIKILYRKINKEQNKFDSTHNSNLCFTFSLFSKYMSWEEIKIEFINQL
jgi:hypothetical protein